ncbi:kelch-like protein 3 [Dioscorea cayenensis subsp. rotundata]|uniref:Kelch-like protein 3 n=1 Tax=Dioscorea cayennensis subsp. rotundata TaxID=55577 RepID=A0AB40D2S6_DIOCR|nr:kelch-like protein 3 [Dioscorea cayenensis subsp. rotundata]
MVAGKKTMASTFPDFSSKFSKPGNSAVSHRNLSKSDLGGMIFGCKHHTMAECLSKLLFGLPALHYPYVRNVEPNLPLFLFNYDDRKLYGIYEAACHGVMNIDPHAWTDDGAWKTPFPAQVRIRVKIQCQPLLESQYRKIIERNYYQGQHFWFELDHTQTRGLIALFRPCPTNTIPATIATRRSSSSTASPVADWKSVVIRGHVDTEAAIPKKNSDASPAVNSNMFASLDFDHEESDCANSSKMSSAGPEDIVAKEPAPNSEELGKDFVDTPHVDATPDLNVSDQTLPKQQYADERFQNEVEAVVLKLQTLSAKRSSLLSSSLHSENECSSSLHSETDLVSSVATIDLNEDIGKISEETPILTVEDNIELDHYQGKEEVVQLVKEIKAKSLVLEKKQVESDQEIQRLKDLVKHSERKIEQLEEHLKDLETKLEPSITLDESLNKFVDQYFGSDKVIYLIGGYDGVSWLSSLDAFSPSLDILTPLKSMSTARSYASAVALHGSIYAFGGGESSGGNVWHKTVECYNPKYDEWTMCSPMSTERGNLAGATLNGKIFAIGGGKGSDCYFDVEMFDPALNKWFNSTSMHEKRLALGAAELHGTLYAVGGYNGYSYLQSAERYDPRERYWTRLPNMNSIRACYSLQAFNEKLYAIGGYDGKKMVSSVETFDPRMGSWLMDEPMKFARGYAASVVLDNALLVIGGSLDGDNVTENVESYKDCIGWTNKYTKAITKRCFFSAAVL